MTGDVRATTACVMDKTSRLYAQHAEVLKILWTARRSKRNQPGTDAEPVAKVCLKCVAPDIERVSRGFLMLAVLCVERTVVRSRCAHVREAGYDFQPPSPSFPPALKFQ
jgi:hypothetical protein